MDGYKHFSSTQWSSYQDSQGRTFVKFIGNISNENKERCLVPAKLLHEKVLGRLTGRLEQNNQNMAMYENKTEAAMAYVLRNIPANLKDEREKERLINELIEKGINLNKKNIELLNDPINKLNELLDEYNSIDIDILIIFLIDLDKSFNISKINKVYKYNDKINEETILGDEIISVIYNNTTFGFNLFSDICPIFIDWNITDKQHDTISTFYGDIENYEIDN